MYELYRQLLGLTELIHLLKRSSVRRDLSFFHWPIVAVNPGEEICNFRTELQHALGHEVEGWGDA
jgi:hypothetical protein